MPAAASPKPSLIRTLDAAAVRAAVEAHARYLKGLPNGRRAVLQYVNLNNYELDGVDLSEADLTGALLGGAINMVTPTGKDAGFSNQFRLDGGSFGMIREHVAIARQIGDWWGVTKFNAICSRDKLSESTAMPSLRKPKNKSKRRSQVLWPM